MIPKLIHQTWKTKDAPARWKPFIDKVQYLNPDWKYQLWSDDENDAFVKSEYPEFYEVFTGFSRGIMRADVIRYLIMYKLGGVYLDLDYEVLKPFDFGNNKVVLPLNRSIAYGDPVNGLGNCFFASEPGHKIWENVITDLQNNPPRITDYVDVIEATGPLLLTRIFNENKCDDIYLPERLIYHPPTPTNKRDENKIKNNGVSLGIHHPWGSWKERWSIAYIMKKLRKILKIQTSRDRQ